MTTFEGRRHGAPRRGGTTFGRVKRAADIALALCLFVPFALLVPGLWVANRAGNRGPLFFRQRRMGRGCRPFTLVKFRTMVPQRAMLRGFDDPLERDRITPLGAWLRRTRIDELPQILNVLAGDMSFIGPRPDAWEHATAYCRLIEGYRERHGVRPGISGLAQLRLGYVEGLEATRRKVRADLAYMRRQGLALDLAIARRTAALALAGIGLTTTPAAVARSPTRTATPIAPHRELAIRGRG